MWMALIGVWLALNALLVVMLWIRAVRIEKQRAKRRQART